MNESKLTCDVPVELKVGATEGRDGSRPGNWPSGTMFPVP
jgi:hypothetical protein